MRLALSKEELLLRGISLSNLVDRLKQAGIDPSKPAEITVEDGMMIWSQDDPEPVVTVVAEVVEEDVVDLETLGFTEE